MERSFISVKLENFIYSLDKPTVAKFRRLRILLEKYQEKLGMPHSKQLAGNLYELRIRGKQELRVFYCFHNNKTYFVHAFIKKSQRTPLRELRTASLRIRDLTKK